jgi:hypothetical protein
MPVGVIPCAGRPVARLRRLHCPIKARNLPPTPPLQAMCRPDAPSRTDERKVYLAAGDGECDICVSSFLPVTKKPFDLLTEGLPSKNSRDDWTPLDLFIAGVRSRETCMRRILSPQVEGGPS